MRRRRHEEHVNHERWAIPYGDLITLLLAFFVVMYAMSAVNEGKYRVLSQSIIEAFNGNSKRLEATPSRTPSVLAPVPDAGASSTATSSQRRIELPLRRQPVPGRGEQPTVQRTGGQQQNLERIQGEVQHALQPLIDKSLITMRRTESYLEIEIRTDILFPSGVAKLSTSADEVLSRIGQILSPFPNPLRVEGYTDDKPINTAQFPSNWELSAARAASVARLFADQGVDPGRLGIIGWGEFRPAADNGTEEGRNRNRRVLVVVLSDGNAPSRFYTDAEHPLADREPGTAPATAASAAALPALPALIGDKPFPPTPTAAAVIALPTPQPDNKG
ncbi:MAG TPA: flagellar motor protein MotD [Dyella sp.]|uniref:flagellar motor protein MotD n=1 Tax=Dyella sp. TaxID=1869338 RepID=UPI002F933ED8